MKMTRKDFLTSCGAFAATTALARPIRSDLAGVGIDIIPENFGPSTLDYVQDGLVAMWDGIENAGRGIHNSNLQGWVDLSGNGFDLQPGNPGTGGRFERYMWTQNSLVRKPEWDGASGYALELTSEQSEYLAGLMPWDGNSTGICISQAGFSTYNMSQVVYGSASPTSFVIYGAYISNNKVGFGTKPFMSSAGRNFLPANAPLVEDMAFISYSYRFSDGTLLAQMNNAWATVKSGFNYGERTYGKFTLMWPGNCNCHNVRLYNRVLSDEEVAHNYSIDQERFGVGV